MTIVNNDDDSLISGETVRQAADKPQSIPQPPKYASAVENASGPAPEMGPMHWYANNTDGNPLGALIGSSMGGEIMNILKNSMLEIFKGATKEMVVSIIPIDRERYRGFHYSSLVLALSKPNTKKTVYFVLILEATNDPITTVNRTLAQGGNVEITRLSSDAADNALYDRVKEVLKTKFPDHQISGVDSCIIPRDFDVKDDGAVRQVAYMAALACGNELAIDAPGFEDLRIRGLTQTAKRSLNLLINYGRILRTDAVSHPTRSDVRCILKDTPPMRVNDLQVNTPERSTYLAEVNGFMDVMYVGGNDVNPYLPNQSIKVDNYAARFVITDIDRLPGYTIGSMLLAISTVSILATENYWMLAFRPQSSSRDQLDITDIGALGYEIDFTRNPETAHKKIDTKSEGFNSQMLASYLSSILKPGLIVSLDVPDAAPQTWYTRIFAAAERNVVNAVRRIIDSATYLTDGNFPANYDVNNIFADVGNRIHMGYYYNKDGQKRDIREIDYLAVANFYGENDRQKIVDWSDTFTRHNIPIEIRLAERKKMIQAMTDNHVEFTGYATRVTFSSHFLDELVKSIKNAGLTANMVPPLSTENFNAVRTGINYAGAAFMGGNGYAVPSVSGNASPIMGGNQYIDSRF